MFTLYCALFFLLWWLGEILAGSSRCLSLPQICKGRAQRRTTCHLQNLILKWQVHSIIVPYANKVVENTYMRVSNQWQITMYYKSQYTLIHNNNKAWEEHYNW